MKIKSIAKTIQQFFDENSDFLLGAYPGLKVQRLIRDYCDYFFKNADIDYMSEVDPYFSLLSQGRPLEYIFYNAFFKYSVNT